MSIIILSTQSGTCRGMDLVVNLDEMNSIVIRYDRMYFMRFDSGKEHVAEWQSYSLVDLWAKMRKDLRYQLSNESMPSMASAARRFESALTAYSGLRLELKAKAYSKKCVLTARQFEA